MVRSNWLGPVSALLALAGQAGAQSTPPAQPTAGGPQEQVISVREFDKPAQKCRVLKTWKQADGSIAYQVQALDTGAKMTIVEATVPGATGATTTTRILQSPSDKAVATSEPPTAVVAQTSTPGRSWFGWPWHNSPSSTTTIAAAPQASAPAAPSAAALPPLTFWSTSAPSAPSNTAASPGTAAGLPARDWRQSWGSTQASTPVNPTPAPFPSSKRVTASADLPGAEVQPYDPLLHPEDNARVQSLLGRGAEAPPFAAAVSSGSSHRLAPTPSASPAPPAVEMVVPPGMGSVLAANAPELAVVAPPPGHAGPPPVEMNAYEANAFCTPVAPKPTGPEGPGVAPSRVAPDTIPPSVLALLPKGPPEMPPLPPDPTGMERQMRLAAAMAQGYPSGGMVLPMPPRYVPPAQLAPPPEPQQTVQVLQTSSQLPLEASLPQLTEMLRGAYYPSQREWAASQLSTMNWHDEPGVVMSLMTAARSDAAPLVRAACVRSLAGMTTSPLPVADTLQVLCQDPDVRVRQEAEQALAGKVR